MLAVAGETLALDASSARRAQDDSELRARRVGSQRIPAQVLDQVLFQDMLIRERSRSDRFEQPFALLIVARKDGRRFGMVKFRTMRAGSEPSALTADGRPTTDVIDRHKATASDYVTRVGRVLLFDPTNPESAAYNPLLEVRRGDAEVRDVQNVADILVDPEGALERRSHWEKTSHSLLVGAILHVLYAGSDKTLAGVAEFLSDPRRPIEATLRAMMATPHLGDRPRPGLSGGHSLLQGGDDFLAFSG